MQRTAATPTTSGSTSSARPWLMIGAAATTLACVALAAAGYVQPVVLGVVQGLAEFLPISSSAHLILVPWLLGWQGGVVDTLTFDVALHLGTLIAVVAFFWRDWLGLIQAAPGWLRSLAGGVTGARVQPASMHERLLGLIVLATLPGGIAGILLDSWAEHTLRAPLLLAVTLPVMGVLLFAADRWRPQSMGLEALTWRQGLLIGLAQACAIIPGVSRSGVTITSGRALMLDRTAAARFSFLLSAPITAAAVLFKLNAILHIPANEVATFVVGVIVSAAVGALAIGGLLAYLRRAGFAAFAAYRVLVAVAIILVAVMRG